MKEETRGDSERKEEETSRQTKTKGERRVGRRRERRTEIQRKDKRDAHRGRKRQVDKYR
jgi:hypothetical protein